MINILREKTPEQVTADIQGFAEKYVIDWEVWLAAKRELRPKIFVKILGKWQATRPVALRRLKALAEHSPPDMDDLLERARPFMYTLRFSNVSKLKNPTAAERKAITGLWDTFSLLPQTGSASCVGISKAVLLLSDGRIGPAFDSQVRKKLGIPHLVNADQWISALEAVSADIRAFESKYDIALHDLMPERYRDLEYGRLYDMALGPR